MDCPWLPFVQNRHLSDLGESNMPIRKTSRGYKIDNVPGYHKTKASAERQLRAIKANQNKRGK